jgi:hypothetical protein
MTDIVSSMAFPFNKFFDGTFSPGCTCHHDSNKGVLNFKE